MTLESGKEMDRKCVFDWLNEVYYSPSLSYNQHTDDEIRIFAHDALVLLKEQEAVVRCKDCKYWDSEEHNCNIKIGWFACGADWFCADGKRRQE